MSSWSPWEDTSYCWVVICKNKKFHRHAGEQFANKIPLAETDAIADGYVFRVREADDSAV